MPPWLTVIGIGDDGIDGLNSIARTALDGADVLVGGSRHLGMVAEDGRPRIEWKKPLASTIEEIIERRGQSVAVLATGNPMWYGIGATLSRSMDPGELCIIPAPSAFSLAASRLGWALADVECLTVHGRSIDRVRYFLNPDARLIILSNDGETPYEIGRILTDTGFGDSELNVLTHMSGPLEEIITTKARAWGKRPVADLNTIAVHCVADGDYVPLSSVPGLPDDAFTHDGQLTKREIRSASIAALAPFPGQTLWDIGAGSGSIAIEWMRSCPRAAAIAVERNAARAANIRDNAMSLGVPDLQIVVAEAAAALDTLAAPDAVFIGGGLSTPEIIEKCWNALKPGGRLVANSVTFEGEHVLMDWTEKCDGELVRFEISRSGKLGQFNGWEPMKPVTQLRAIKNE
ncbi:MAG: precorrin-6y C5,15-methyltransferase (decarboxylating) subunit CbiE [Rhodospirillales bacterium]|nr:precorrin-6y C5,15-methyltransferase (decarboxylating) subunit CbiE [Rhodospirillales bacterium]